MTIGKKFTYGGGHGKDCESLLFLMEITDNNLGQQIQSGFRVVDQKNQPG